MKESHGGRERPGTECPIGLQYFPGVGDIPPASRANSMQLGGVGQRVNYDGAAEQMSGKGRILRIDANQIAGETDALGVLVPVNISSMGFQPMLFTCWYCAWMGVRRHGLEARATVGRKKIHPPFQLFHRFAHRKRRRGIIGHQPLIAPVQCGFDHVGMFHIHAKNVGNQAAHERKFLLALAEDTFHAFADAFALGFQVFQQFLAG